MLANNKALFIIFTASCILPFIGCNRPARKIVDEYRAAVCILPIGYAKKTQPPILEWDQTLALRDGTAVQVHGLQAPGARIAVKYPKSGAEIGVTEMVDYVYPTDIKIDNNREILYVKTDGYVAGMIKRTRLFAFDLNKRVTIAREEVDNSVLPPECQKPKPENSKP
jgi:hypothetical protein